MDEKSTERIEGEISGINFATEILRQLKDTIRRQWILVIVILSLWFATIGGFVWYLYQYDFVSYEVSTDGGGNANYIGNDGDVFNGISESQNP